MTRAAALALAGLLALAGCTSVEGTGDKGYISGDGQVVQRAVEEREGVIDLAGEDLAGDPLDLADLGLVVRSLRGRGTRRRGRGGAARR